MPQILEENIEHKTLEYQDKVYCVHRVDENIVKQINNLPPDVLLTFDDCLYSQYYYADKIINQNRIYFCCPTLINNSNTFICDIECNDAMLNHFSDNDNSAYMSISQIKELSEKYIIGGHSYYHAHTKYSSKKSIRIKNDKIKDMFMQSKLIIGSTEYIIEDTEKLVEWFKSNLGKIPKEYCFPFNRHNKRLVDILKQYGFEQFYGKERIELS